MAAATNDGVTLIGNDANHQSLYASTSGNDTLEAGGGYSDYLYGGGGVDTLIGGSGSDTFVLSSDPASGSTIEGGSGTNVLRMYSGDISGATVSGIQELDSNTVTLTATQLAGFSTLNSYNGSIMQIYTAGAGTYDLSSMSTSSWIILQAATNDGTTLIGNDANYSILKASASGDDTLQAGSGANTNLYGGGGYVTYKFGSSFGGDTIFNGYAGSQTTASGEVDFLGGTTDENLWFQQSGNDLQINLLGTSDQITLSNWFGSNAKAQVEKFTADGLTLDSQVSSLVSAMATYAAANSSFNPTTATSMPTDTTLQSAIASAWHS
jgi:hypothetical protein